FPSDVVTTATGAVAQEREGQVVGVADPLDATLGRRKGVVEGVGGPVGQLHAWRLAHSGSTGLRSGAKAGSGSTTSQDRWPRSQARIAWLRWAGSPSHTSVAFCPPRKRRSPSRSPTS